MMKIGFVILLSTLIYSCSGDRKEEINHAMRDYDKLVQHLATDSMANLYAIDGELAGVGQNSIIGRDSIRIFLKSFADSNVKVITYASTSDSTTMIGSAAIQYGSYNQIVKMPSGDTLELGGNYIATWNEQVTGSWLIKKMYTYNYKNLR